MTVELSSNIKHETSFTNKETQLSHLINSIGGCRFILAQSPNHPAPFIISDDREPFDTHYDENANKIRGLNSLIYETSKPDVNLLVSLGPVIIEKSIRDKYAYADDELFSLFIIDLDVGHNSGDDGIESFKKHFRQYGFDETRTLSVRTKSGGLHLYYFVPTRLVREWGWAIKVGVLPGVDLKTSEIGEKVRTIPAPGSYATDEDGSVKHSYHIDEANQIQRLPNKFIEYLNSQKEYYSGELRDAISQVAIAAAEGIDEDADANILKAEQYLSKIITDVMRKTSAGEPNPYVGSRNDAMNVFSYRMSSFGLSLSNIRKYCSELNEMAFDHPLDERELESTVVSAYEARVAKNETYVNADLDIPEFDPIIGDISISAISERLDAFPINPPINKVANTLNGLKLISDLTFYVGGTYIFLRRSPVHTAYEEFERILATDQIVDFSSIWNTLSSIELKHSPFKSESTFNQNFGPIMRERPEGQKGRMSLNLTANPVFTNRLRRNVSRGQIGNPSLLIEKDTISITSPPPITFFGEPTESEREHYAPIIQELIELYRDTLTNPEKPKEIEFLLDSVSAFVKGITAPKSIVLRGSFGSGKSTFMNMLSCFTSETDWTMAGKPDDVAAKHAVIGSLVTIDDCDLNSIRQLDVIKSRISQTVHTYEQKFMDPVKVRKTTHMFMGTNRDSYNIEFLQDRRTTWLKGQAVYNGQQYAEKINSICRRLIENEGTGLKCLYHFFKDREIKIRDWNFKTQAQMDLISHALEVVRDAPSDSNNQQISMRQERLKSQSRQEDAVRVVNMIANLGCLPEEFDCPPLPLYTRHEDFADYATFESAHKDSPEEELYNDVRLHSGISSYDFGFILRHFRLLSDGKIESPEAFAMMFESDAKSVRAFAEKLSTFTREVRKKSKPIYHCMGWFLSPVNKKITPKIEAFHLKKQYRVIIPAPMILWIPRLSFLISDSLSAQWSESVIEDYHLEEIVSWIQNLDHEPNYKERKAFFGELFPDQTLGSYNYVGEREAAKKMDIESVTVSDDDWDE